MDLLTVYIEVSLAAFFIVFAMLTYVVHQTLKIKHKLEFHTQTYIKKQSELDIFEQASLGIGKRLVELELQLQAVNDRISRIETHGQDNNGSYPQAIKLIELGAGIDEIAQSCGISKIEAELLLVLNKKRTKTPL